MLTRTHMVLAALLLIVVFLTGAVSTDHSQPNIEFLPEMKRSPAASAYAPSSVFPNGRTLQVPVAGTIARGELPLHYAATKEDAIRAGEELKSPYAIDAAVNDLPSETVVGEKSAGQPADAAGTPQPGDKPPTAEELQARREAQARERLQASIGRGEAIYHITCISCHGPSGAGDGPVAKRGFPPPPPLTTGKSVQMKDGQLFHILTYGQGSMASMAAQLSQPRRWDVINYVRSMQQRAAASLQQAAAGASPPAEPAAPTAPNAGAESDRKPGANAGTEADPKSDAEPDETETPSGTEEGTP